MNAIEIVLAALALAAALVGYAAAWLFLGWAWATHPTAGRSLVATIGVGFLALLIGIGTFVAVTAESADQDMGGLAVLFIEVWIVAPSMLLTVAALATSVRLAVGRRRSR